MLEQNDNVISAYVHMGFVTIRIFARTELFLELDIFLESFVTIRIFARTEQFEPLLFDGFGFVTIRIFARTEQA